MAPTTLPNSSRTDLLDDDGAFGDDGANGEGES